MKTRLALALLFTGSSLSEVATANAVAATYEAGET